jgi:putative N6-adenine-specific DNA methylase
MEELKENKAAMQLTAKTFAGLENLLAEELTAIGATDVEVINRGVKFSGSLEVLYKANYMCRTAVRILKPVVVFTMNAQEDLYTKVMEINWPDVFQLNQTFVVDANVFYSEITHSQYAALRVKDAIVDQFREKTGKRPWVGKEDADIHIDVHISHNVCTVSLDSSGESLHKRGYRIDTDKAPISEVLAAGIVLLSGWKGETDLYEPMCGSGTIAIEATMISNNIPAGYYRKKFAFMNWAGFDKDLWEKIKKEEDAKISEAEHSIFASDRSEKAVNIAKRNIKNAGLHKDIELKVSFFDEIVPEKQEGILVFNPPYGKRLEERGEIIDLYRSIGDTLKKNFSGFEAWIISPDTDIAKFIGLRPSARIHLFNGPIETRLIKFELYAGSKKGKYMDEEQKVAWRKERGKTDSDGNREFKKNENPSWRKRNDNSEKRSFEKSGERKYGGVKKTFNKEKNGFQANRKTGGKPR